MLTRPIDNSSLASRPFAPSARSMEMSARAVPLLDPVEFADRRHATSHEWLDQSVVDTRALGRGLTWALGIEGVAALLIYGAWHLWTILR